MDLSALRSALEVGRSEWTKGMKFTKVLGAGSFGVVLKGEDKSGITSASAVKIVFSESPTNLGVNPQQREKILREVDTIVGKRHENIVETTNFAEKSLGHKDIDRIFKKMELEERAEELVAICRSRARKGPVDTIWIQMQLCGHYLRSWLNQNNLIQVDVKLHIVQLQCGIVKGLVEGLKYLHQNKIVHRDFKPENIYFTQDYLLPVKIGDFGLSREIGENTTTLTSKVGTSDYRAPEADSKDYSFQADLYSLGLVMWEVVQLISNTQRRSFFDRLVYDREESLVNDHPRIANCKEMIIKLTRRSREERTQNIEEINLIILSFKITNSDELRMYLKLAIGGDIIELDVGEYEGPFDMRQARVTLKGQGEGTRIRNKLRGTNGGLVAGIKITGNNCQVLCLKVICDSDDFTYGIVLAGVDNRIADIHFQGGVCCLDVAGDDNNLSTLSITNSRSGIVIEGRSNKLDNIKIKEVTEVGIYIVGANNQIKLVSCDNVRWGLGVVGDNNRLTNVDHHNTRVSGLYGVNILGGRGNIIDNLKCSGFINFGLFLFPSTSKSIIINSVCDGISVDGSDHTGQCGRR